MRRLPLVPFKASEHPKTRPVALASSVPTLPSFLPLSHGGPPLLAKGKTFAICFVLVH